VSRGLWIAVAAVAAAVVVVAVVAAIVRESGDEEVRAEFPPPPACEAGAEDRNPEDEPVAPSRDKRLIPEVDGHIPIGFNDSSHQRGWLTLDEALRLYELAGMTLTRLPLDWGAVETSPGELDFGDYDEIYCTALAAGVRPVWHLTGIPAWAAPDAQCADPCVRPPEDEHLPQLERFAEIAAARYPRAAAVEAWNEPNLRGFWGGTPDPAAYADVLEAIYTGTKNGNPKMPVLGGALSNNPTDSETGLSLRTFLAAMLEEGAAEHMDGFSFHPYPIQPVGTEGEQFTPAFDAARELLEPVAPGIRLWVTEAGVPTEQTPFAPPFPPDQQAAILADTFVRLDDDPDVDAALFHSLMDVPEGESGAPGFGFFTQPDEEGEIGVKPAVCTIRTAVGLGGECPQVVLG
jgi:hypothetical protein